MCSGLFGCLELASGFDDDINLEFFPWQFPWRHDREDGNPVPVYDQGVVFCLNLSFVFAVDGIVRQQIGEVFGRRQVIDGDDLQSGMPPGNLERLSSNATESVDGYSCGHGTHSCSSLLDAWSCMGCAFHQWSWCASALTATWCAVYSLESCSSSMKCSLTRRRGASWFRHSVQSADISAAGFPQIAHGRA